MIRDFCGRLKAKEGMNQHSFYNIMLFLMNLNWNMERRLGEWNLKYTFNKSNIDYKEVI